MELMKVGSAANTVQKQPGLYGRQCASQSVNVLDVLSPSPTRRGRLSLKAVELEVCISHMLPSVKPNWL